MCTLAPRDRLVDLLLVALCNSVTTTATLPVTHWRDSFILWKDFWSRMCGIVHFGWSYNRRAAITKKNDGTFTTLTLPLALQTHIISINDCRLIIHAISLRVSHATGSCGCPLACSHSGEGRPCQQHENDSSFIKVALELWKGTDGAA